MKADFLLPVKLFTVLDSLEPLEKVQCYFINTAFNYDPKEAFVFTDIPKKMNEVWYDINPLKTTKKSNYWFFEVAYELSFYLPLTDKIGDKVYKFNNRKNKKLVARLFSTDLMVEVKYIKDDAIIPLIVHKNIIEEAKKSFNISEPYYIEPKNNIVVGGFEASGPSAEKAFLSKYYIFERNFFYTLRMILNAWLEIKSETFRFIPSTISSAQIYNSWVLCLGKNKKGDRVVDVRKIFVNNRGNMQLPPFITEDEEEEILQLVQKPEKRPLYYRSYAFARCFFHEGLNELCILYCAIAIEEASKEIADDYIKINSLSMKNPNFYMAIRFSYLALKNDQLCDLELYQEIDNIRDMRNDIVHGKKLEVSQRDVEKALESTEKFLDNIGYYFKSIC